MEEFLAQLEAHALDLVLSDAPASPGRSKVVNHRLGDTGTTIFGTAELRRAYRDAFPQSLQGAPCLVAGFQSGHRRALEVWFDEHGIRPEIVAEMDDISLLLELGAAGATDRSNRLATGVLTPNNAAAPTAQAMPVPRAGRPDRGG